MTTTSADILPATPARRTVGGIRMGAGLLVLAAMVTQITDEVVHSAFKPEEYFSYFTIQSSMMNIVVLLVGGYLALKFKRDTVLYTGVRMATVVYAIVTGVVYNVLLRGIPAVGYVGIQWPTEIEHVWIPLYIVMDWLFATGRPKLSWKWLWVVVSYPILWCAFTLVRGYFTGWYPYPFIDPVGDGGWPSVLGYILGLSAFMVGLAAVAIWYTRLALLQKDE